MEHTLSHKELREQAIAEALARRRSHFKTKKLRELTQESQNLISALNKTPTTLINERLNKLNEDLSKLSQDKIKQLDEELKDYLNQNMILPDHLKANRPWLRSSDNNEDISKN